MIKTTVYRNINGFFLLNKPPGISSNDALQIIRHHLKINKAGHAGTLDPLASGLLVILFGQGTKFSQWLLNQSKTYEVTAKLGIMTTTGDIEGNIIEQKPVPSLTEMQVSEVLQKFVGKTEQLPPAYSALKYEGQPLYKLARKNAPVFIEKREIQVDSIELLSFKQDLLTLRIRCSKGTYIRTLVEDIGKAMGCGAHCFRLKRTVIGSYSLAEAHGFFDLYSHQQPLSLIAELNQLFLEAEKTIVSDAAAYYLLRGQSIIYPWPLPDKQDTLYLYLESGAFLGIGKVLSNGWIAPERLVDPSTLVKTIHD